MKRRLSSSALYFPLMVVLSHLLLPDAARAGLLQTVIVGQGLDGVGITSASDEVFGATSADITGNILAQIGAFPALGFQAPAGVVGATPFDEEAGMEAKEVSP